MRTFNSTSGNKIGTDAWERLWWVWAIFFYTMLIATTALALVSGEMSRGEQALAISLSALLGVWYGIVMFLFGDWGERLLLKLSFATGAMGVWFLLTGLHPVYFFLLFLIYGSIFGMLPMRWALPSSLFLTTVVTLRFLIDSPASATISVLLQGLFWAVFGTFWAFWIYTVINQSRKRRALIEELEATREELAKEERRAGMLEERGRLAREIHDTLAQGFISIVTHLEAAEDALSLGKASGPGQRHLDQARITARESLVEARRLVRALQPDLLESSSLPEALERLARRWSGSSGTPVDVSITGNEKQLPQELQVTLFRVAQEALSNAQKHAGASRVDLTLSYIEDLVVMDVQDDGVGFDPTLSNNDSEGGFGLQAMRERIGQVGGKLLVESAPGEGTTLAVELPVEALVFDRDFS